MLRERIANKEVVISVYGLGYVGLPTAVHFADKGFKVIGVDVKEDVVEKLNKGEVHLKELGLEKKLKELIDENRFYATTNGIEASKQSDIKIICVPTPIDDTKKPILDYVFSAAEDIAKGLKKGDVVVLESTVHPTFSEEELIPFLEQKSGLKINKDFYVAHVPERYNPGDKEHTLDKIVRVVGASSYEVAKDIGFLYKYVVRDTFIVKDLRTAEASKIIENTQRDLNIGLMNELAIIFDKINVDIKEVIEAASTKWNFIKFYPGLGVGGHCLPVDPFYLTHLASKKGYHSKIILAGRSINDSMPDYALSLLIKEMNKIGKTLKNSNILLLGLSYKGNIGDFRNSPAKKLALLLEEYEANIIVHDPFINGPLDYELFNNKDVVIIATDHDDYKDMNLKDIAKRLREKAIFFDTRMLYDKEMVEKEGIKYLGIGRG